MFLPGRPSFILNMTGAPTAGIATYKMSATFNSSVILLLDDHSGHRLTTPVIDVDGDSTSDSACIPTSLLQHQNATTPSAPSSSPTLSKLGFAVVAGVISGVVLVVLLLMAVYLYSERRRRRSIPIQNEDDYDHQSLDKGPSPPPMRPSRFGIPALFASRSTLNQSPKASLWSRYNDQAASMVSREGIASLERHGPISSTSIDVLGTLLRAGGHAESMRGAAARCQELVGHTTPYTILQTTMPMSPSKSTRGRCLHIACRVRPCASYLLNPLNPHLRPHCWCSHEPEDHEDLSAALTINLPPRGGLVASNCLAFRPRVGNLIRDYFEDCQCGQPYSAHSALPTPSNHVTRLPMQEMGAVANLMHPTHHGSNPTGLAFPPIHGPQPEATQHQTNHAFPSVPAGEPGVTWATLPQYQAPAILTPAPYQRMGAFGVPMARIPMHTTTGSSSHGRSSRKNTHPSSYKVKKPAKVTVMDVVMFPKDHAVRNKSNEHSVLPPLKIRNGEAFASDLAFLQHHGLVRRVELRTARISDLVMDQVYNAVRALVREGNLEFPPYQPSPLELGEREANRNQRIQFHHLPFRVLAVGNRTVNGQYIKVNNNAVFHDFQHMKIAKTATKCKHPTDEAVGILLLCPKGGDIIGPLHQGHTDKHFCFANHVTWHLVKNFGGDDDDSEDENSVACEPGCPRPETPDHRDLIMATEPISERQSSPASVHSDSHLPFLEPGSREHSPELPPVADMLGRPDYNALVEVIEVDDDVDVPEHTCMDSPVPDNNRPLFSNWEEYHDHLMSNSDPVHNRSFFNLRAINTHEAVVGLVDFLMFRHRNPTTTYIPSQDVHRGFYITPAGITLNDIFSHFWSFKAGHTVAHDAVGDGVIRQILDEAIQYCLAKGICDCVNPDGYVSLKVSTFVSSRRLDLFFALGFLCTAYLIKVRVGPDPISPALLQAAIGGFNSLYDLAWLRKIVPDVAEEISLLAPDYNCRIPHPNIQDRLSRSIQCRMSATLTDILEASSDDWPQYLPQIYDPRLSPRICIMYWATKTFSTP